MRKDEIIKDLKKQFATIVEGSDEQGYVELNAAEYEERIAQWATSVLEKELEEAAVQEANAKRQAAIAKLALLGLERDDLKALGF